MRSLNFQGKMGDQVAEMICPHCKETIEIFLACIGRIKARKEVLTTKLEQVKL